MPRPGQGDAPPPWLVDRLFRNLLVDVTGNTHRAEICIDKLYSPDGPTGRLGLVEFRGFEMPPNPRMSLAQQLLIRALIARLWQAPARRPLRALGHGAARPLHAAALRLGRTSSTCSTTSRGTASTCVRNGSRRSSSSASRSAARSSIDGVKLELRQALEPWHVMGETGRDRRHRALRRFSSVERLQVKTEGLDPERYVVACNGRRCR